MKKEERKSSGQAKVWSSKLTFEVGGRKTGVRSVNVSILNYYSS